MAALAKGIPLEEAALASVHSDKSHADWKSAQHLYYLLSGSVVTKSEGHHLGKDEGPADVVTNEAIDLYYEVKDEKDPGHLVPGVPLKFLRHAGWLHLLLQEKSFERELREVEEIFKGIKNYVERIVDNFVDFERKIMERYKAEGHPFTSPSFDGKLLVTILAERKEILVRRWTEWFQKFAHSKNVSGLAQLVYDFSHAAEQLFATFDVADSSLVSQSTKEFRATIHEWQAKLEPYHIKTYSLYPISLVKLIEDGNGYKKWDAFVPLTVHRNHILSTLPGDGWKLGDKGVVMVGNRRISFTSTQSPIGAERIWDAWENDAPEAITDVVHPLSREKSYSCQACKSRDGRFYWSPTMDPLCARCADDHGWRVNGSEILPLRAGSATTNWPEVNRYVENAAELWSIAEHIHGKSPQIVRAKKDARALYIHALELQKLARDYGVTAEHIGRLRIACLDKVNAQVYEAKQTESRPWPDFTPRITEIIEIPAASEISSSGSGSITAGKNFSIKRTDDTKFSAEELADIPYKQDLGSIHTIYRAPRTQEITTKLEKYTGTEVAVYKNLSTKETIALINDVKDEIVEERDRITFDTTKLLLAFASKTKISEDGKNTEEITYLIGAKDSSIWIWPLTAKALASVGSNPLDPSKAVSHPGKIQSIEYHSHHGLISVLYDDPNKLGSLVKLWKFNSPSDLKEVGSFSIAYKAKNDQDLRVLSNKTNIYVLKSHTNALEIWGVGQGNLGFGLTKSPIWTYRLAEAEGSTILQAGVLAKVAYISSDRALIPVDLATGARAENIRLLRRYDVTSHRVVAIYPDINYVLVADGLDNYKLHDLGRDRRDRTA